MPTFPTIACAVLFGFAAVTSARRFPNGPKGTPIVDLGYEVYTAASFNVSLVMMIIMENIVYAYSCLSGVGRLLQFY